MGTEVQVNNRADEIAEQSIEFFDLVSSEKATPKQLAVEYGLSQRTVYNRINQGREIYEAQLRKIADKLIADVWKKYEYIWEQAKLIWDERKDLFALKEMRAVLEAQRKMLSLDSAAKAPVNPDGSASVPVLQLVIDDSAYKQKEADFNQKIISGEYKIAEDETSTTVLLTDTEDVIK